VLNKLCSYLWATDDEFREEYYEIYEDFVDTFDDYLSVNLDDIGYCLLNHWSTQPELIEEYPDFVDDILDSHDLTNDEILEVILNGGHNSGRSQGTVDMDQQSGSGFGGGPEL
jgi:hypothetical protein